jgi:hypothetical protein
MLKYWIIVQILLRKLVRELNGQNSKRRKRIERRKLIRRFDRAEEELEALIEASPETPRLAGAFALFRLSVLRADAGIPRREIRPKN